jgi:hypothetical protein
LKTEKGTDMYKKNVPKHNSQSPKASSTETTTNRFSRWKRRRRFETVFPLDHHEDDTPKDKDQA